MREREEKEKRKEEGEGEGGEGRGRDGAGDHDYHMTALCHMTPSLCHMTRPQPIQEDYEEFEQWLDGLSADKTHPYLDKIVATDLKPCLSFRNTQV